MSSISNESTASNVAFPLAQIITKISATVRQAYTVKDEEIAKQWAEIGTLAQQAHQLINEYDQLHQQM